MAIWLIDPHGSHANLQGFPNLAPTCQLLAEAETLEEAQSLLLEGVGQARSTDASPIMIVESPDSAWAHVGFDDQGRPRYRSPQGGTVADVQEAVVLSSTAVSQSARFGKTGPAFRWREAVALQACLRRSAPTLWQGEALYDQEDAWGIEVVEALLEQVNWIPASPWERSALLKWLVATQSMRVIDGVLVDLQTANLCLSIGSRITKAETWRKWFDLPMAKLGPRAWKLVA